MEFSSQETVQIESNQQEDFLGKRRRVRWSLELEEVHYFVPLPQKTESRWKKKMKHMKEKALDLKHKPMILFWDFYDNNTVQLFHSRLECLVKKINGRSEKLDFEDIRDINKPWDELFELYTTREEVSQENGKAKETSENFTCT